MNEIPINADRLQSIVTAVRPLLNKRFHDGKGSEYIFYGIVLGSDDFCYGMHPANGGKPLLLSCVGSIDSHGFIEIQKGNMQLLDQQINISSLSPAEFKSLVGEKGWTYRDLARRWKLSEVRISQIARDDGRPLYYDDAVRSLPERIK